MEMRKQYKDARKRHGARLGFMSFFVKAATEALNATQPKNFLSMATISYITVSMTLRSGFSDRGLVVPILRDTDHYELR